MYKAENKQNMSNYRPISVLPLLSKVFERCVATRLMNYLNKFNVLTPYQFGFLKGKKKALNTLLKLTEAIYSSYNKKNTVVTYL